MSSAAYPPAPQFGSWTSGADGVSLLTPLRPGAWRHLAATLVTGWETEGRCGLSETDSYRLPFDDSSFDFVVSTAVLEHARDIEGCHREIKRVLKPGGAAMHMFPSKLCLPVEPHILVPLMSWFWPWRPRVWLALWAILGVRKPNQRGKSWREVVRENDEYLRDHCSYLSTRRHRQASMAIYGNCSWPMEYYIDHTEGGVGRLGRRLPFHRLTGLLSREFRLAFLLQRNDGRSSLAGSTRTTSAD